VLRVSIARTVPDVSPSRIGDVPVPSAPWLLTINPPAVASAAVGLPGSGPPPRTCTPPVNVGPAPTRVTLLVFRLTNVPDPARALPKTIVLVVVESRVRVPPLRFTVPYPWTASRVEAVPLRSSVAPLLMNRAVVVGRALATP
jgi:hypothetical protein